MERKIWHVKDSSAQSHSIEALFVRSEGGFVIFHDGDNVENATLTAMFYAPVSVREFATAHRVRVA